MKVLEIQTWIDEFSPDELIVSKVKEYLEFIETSVESRDESRYSEWHHVIPKCIDERSKFRNEGFSINGRDHVIAHKMLVDCFTHCDKRKRLGYALHMMLRDPLGQRIESLTPEEYEEIRRIWSESVTGFKRPSDTRRRLSETLGDGRLRGEGHPLYGKHHSSETREKISLAVRSVWTEEKRKEFSERRKGSGNPCYGKKVVRGPASDESRERMSASGRGKIWINDGLTSTKVSSEEDIPEGWVRGRLSFSRSSNGQEGKIWINDGKVSRKINKDAEIPEGFTAGRLRKVENKVS